MTLVGMMNCRPDWSPARSSSHSNAVGHFELVDEIVSEPMAQREARDNIKAAMVRVKSVRRSFDRCRGWMYSSKRSVSPTVCAHAAKENLLELGSPCTTSDEYVFRLSVSENR